MRKIPVTILTLCVLTLLVCAASASVLSIGNGQVAAIGSTASVNIVLDEATAGLSGYSLNVSVENPGVATISSVSYPSWASLTQTSTLPASECRIKASDTGEQVQAGATNVPIATVTFQGLAGGSTVVHLVVNMMNDDADDPMNPTISAGTFTVDVPIVVPVAAFAATPTSGALPLTVAFTDQSTNAPTSSAWDFGDGATSTDRNPSHQYTTAGIFTVTLTATNSAGSDSEVKADYITAIPEAPVANFAKNVSSGQAPLAVQFTDTSTGGDPTSWAWDFQNDGTIDSTEENPVFVYTIPGTYSINLTVANLGGTSSKLKENQITVTAPPAPVAAFTSDVQSGMAPLTVTFTDQSTNVPTSWAWTFGDGGTSDQQNPSHQYTTAGTYTVKLTATNIGGSDDEEKTGYITVSATPVAPVAAFTSDVQSGVAPLTVTFTDQSTNAPTSWAWTFGDGATSTDQNPSHQYTTAGTYTVKLTATNAGGSDDEEKTGYITVSAATVAPVAAFTSDVQSGTAPLTVAFTDQSTNTPTSWSWTFGDGTTSDQQNPSHQYTAVGIFNVSLTATNAAGSDSEEKAEYITVSAAPVIAPVADFTVSTTSGSVPLFVRFTDTSTNSPTAWAWDFGDGSTSTIQNPTHNYMAEGTYTVNLTVTNPAGIDSEVKTGVITVTAGSVNGSLATTAWPKFQMNSYNTGQSPNVGPQNAIVNWTFQTGNIFQYAGPSIGEDGTIYLGNRDRKLFAFNPDGTLKWSYTTGGYIYGSPAIAADGTIYIGSYDSKLYAVNPDGTQKWTYTTGARIYGSPAIGSDGTVYVGSFDKKLYAINPDGTLKWSYTAGNYFYYTVPAIGSDGTIYIGNYDSKLYAVNPDGTLKWTYTTGDRICGAPAIGSDGTIYVGSCDGNLYAINPDGTFKWSYTTGGPIYGSPAIAADGTIYVGSRDDKLHALNPDGTFKWSYTTGNDIDGALAIGSDGIVYVGSKDNNVYAFNPDGTLKWSYTTGGPIYGGSPAIGSDGTLYVAANDNKLYAFRDVAPVAAFSGTQTTGPAWLTIAFTDQSANTPTSWAWDFGDGSTSTLQNPTHTYATPGTYTVILTATNAVGSCVETKTGYITQAMVPPVAAFSGTPTSGHAYLTVAFTDQSTNAPSSWAWDFGDGGTSTDKNPTHIYKTQGTYTVTLTATNAAGSGVETKTGYITVGALIPTVASFTSNVTGGYPPLTVQFTDTSFPTPSSWAWDFGDGGTSNEQNPVHTFSQIGTYTVNLTATNAAGSSSATKAGYVFIQPVDGLTTTDGDYTIKKWNITGPASWNVPTDVTEVEYLVVAGGGGASGESTSGGGGAGGLLNGTLPVTPGSQYSVVVGAGGLGGDAHGSIGTSGSDSRFSSIVAIGGGTGSRFAPGVSGGSGGGGGGDGLPRAGGAGVPGQGYAGGANYKTMVSGDLAGGGGGGAGGAGGVAASRQGGAGGNGITSSITGTAVVYACGGGGGANLGPGGTGGSSAVNGGTGGGGGHVDGYPALDGTGSGGGGSGWYGAGGNGGSGIVIIRYLTPVSGTPVAAFSGTPTAGISPLTVDFTDQSTNTPTSWSWNFGDGATSTEQNPSHQYTAAGIYNVSLMATNAGGSDSEAKAGYITVTSAPIPPVADFTSDVQTGIAPLTVNFTDTSTNTPTSWSWNFGDGATSTEQNPSHQYTAAGTYNVSLMATNAAGSDSEAKAGFITVTNALTPPVAAFVAIPSSGTAPLAVQFSDQSTGSPTAWLWDFGDGTTSTVQNPSHTYTSVGTYAVTLTATNADGSDSEEKTGYIHAVDSSQPTIVVTPQTGNVVVGETTQYALTINSLPAGIAGYNLSVSLSNPATAEITAFGLPAWANLNISSAVPGDTVWFSGLDLAQSIQPGATNVPLGTVTVRGDAIGSSQVVVTVSEMDADGGGLIIPSIVNGQLNVYQPVVADFSADNTTGKLPFTVHFTDLSTGDPVPTAWAWDFGDGTTSTDKNPTHTYTSGGQFTVTLTASSTYSQHTVTKANYITVTRHVVTFPGCSNPPLDPDLDGRYEDINGNGRLDFHDVVTLYQNMQWVRDNTEVGVEPFDFNGNGRLDYDDVVLLYYEVLAG